MASLTNGHEFEQALGDGEGQGSLVCCSPWGYKESDATERLRTHIFIGRTDSEAPRLWPPDVKSQLIRKD